MVWIIYTTDHLLDAFKVKGKTEVYRHAFTYKYRVLFIILLISLISLSSFLIFKNKEHHFIKQGVWFSLVIPIYFFLKHTNRLTPIVKMLIISAVVAVVIVNLYDDYFYNVLKLEWVILFLLVFFNQLVLQSYEGKDEHERESFTLLANRIFVWITLICFTIGLMNPAAIPQVLSLLCISLILKLILKKKAWFKQNLYYRIITDFCFVLMWPLLKFFSYLLVFLLKI